MGVSLQHARFFRQLRRLQSLCRLLKKGITTWNSQVTRDETWRAVRTASGFPGGFGSWWQSQGLRPSLAGPLPMLCPNLDFAQGLFEGFQQFVTRYEADLIKHRYQASKQRRASSLAYVFQDCKDDPLPQADTLIDRVEVGIEEVREEDSSLVLVHPVQLLDALPVVVNGQVVEVVAHSEDQVWVGSVQGLTPGLLLTQERAVTSDSAILERFAAVWSRRWLKHSHVLPGQWDQICDFLDKTAKPIQWTCAPWTAARFQQAVRQKKPKAAKGPDGVSQPDLASLPLSACQVFADIFAAVEQGKRWPIQLASGFVSSLAKTPQAQCVDEFRPVVVYSLPYRVWSSERAREALQAVAPLLPNSVQGGVPLRQAKSIWYELAASLELAFLNQEGLHGLLMDIQKCFNNMPRQPLWYVLTLLGFPVPTLRAWVSFVSGQTRRFRVRRSVGAPLVSNCGLPEGCALSVFGMTVVDWILDWWLSALEVRVDLRTFVDDWGVMFKDARSFPRIWSSLEEFQAGTTSQCPWCDARDGFHHRAWICPHFAACRSHLTADQLQALPLLPPCLVDHGWPIVLPEWEVLSRLLLQGDGLCRKSPVGLAAIRSAQMLELFMDGTCAYPREVKLRFAAWSVTIASTTQNTLDNKLLMGGHVSGLCQTAFRAELTAALHAVTWAVQHGFTVRLWCDCQSVVRGLLRGLRGKPISKNAPHSDLWLQLQKVLAGHEQQVHIRKVVSHGLQSRAVDPVEQWAYWHNNLTDTAAEEINFRGPLEFWSAWSALKEALDFHRPLHMAILKVLLQTSKMAVASQGKPHDVVAVPLDPGPQLVIPATWEIPKKIIKRYGEINLDHLHRWWTEWGPQMLQGTHKLVYISGIQLFYSFNLHTGFDGPWCCKKRWYSELAEVPVAGQRPWGERSKNFLLMLKSYWKGNGLIVPTRMTRPSSAALAKWTISYRLRWSPSMIDRIDQIVLQQMGRQVCNQTNMAMLVAAKTS